MNSPIVILCECSGEVAEAMRQQGMSAWSCDLLPGERPRFHIQGNAITALYKGRPTDGMPWRAAGLHWPCTYFANSGVKWMWVDGTSKSGAKCPKRLALMMESVRGLVEVLNDLVFREIPFYFENPVMHGEAVNAIEARCPWFVTARRCTVQPWNFGTWETKRTCLWLHGLPPLVPKYRTTEECRIALGLPEFVTVHGVRVKNTPHPACHLASPGPNRGHERSRTLPTLAKAMASQWAASQPLCLDE